MGRVVAAVLVWVVWSVPVFADTDALELRLKNAEGVSRVALLNELAKTVRDNAPDESIGWARQALETARSIGDEAGQAIALNHLGVAHYYLSEYEMALEFYEESLQVAEASGLKDSVSVALNNIGVIHYIRGDYDQAVEFYSRALEIGLETGDIHGLAKAQNNLGNVYYSAGRYAESLAYYAESIEMYEQIGDEVLVASSLNNIALVYLELNRPDEALDRLNRALELAEKLSHLPTVALTLNNLGDVAAAQERPGEALEYHRRSLEVRRELGDRRGEAESLLSMGQLCVGARECVEARGILERVVDLASEIGVREIERDAWEALAESFANAGEFERALNAHRHFKRVNDELFDEEASRRLSELEARNDLQAKNREIADLRSRQRLQRLVRNVSIASAGLLLVVVALLYNRYRLTRRANEAMRVVQAEREKAARAELAHFARVSTLGEMASALAHELNQPLTAILSNAQTTRRLLREGRASTEQIGEALDDVVEGSGRAREIIVRLRQLMRRGEVSTTRLSLNDVVRDVEGIARPNIKEKGASLTAQLLRDLPDVEGDPIQLQQVTLNLLNNATDAMAGQPSEAVVHVSTMLDDSGEVVLAIRDSGPPVGKDVIDRMFDPFFTTKQDGLGMGLAICRTIIEAHGGRLWAESNRDRGLTVRFALPPSKTQDSLRGNR